MLFTTTIQALDPNTSELLTWQGPLVPGISFKDAEDYCQKHGLGYCKVDGVFCAELPEDADLETIKRALENPSDN